NNASDLGAFGTAFRDIYASSSLRVGSGAASSTISSSGNITLTGHIFPGSNNASDLGAFGTAFRDIYASNTLRIGSSTTTLTLDGRDIQFSATASIRSTPTDVASNAALVVNTFNTLSNADLLRLLSNGTTQFSVGPTGSIAASGTLFLAGTGSSTFAGPIRPSSNNAIDLGGFGSAWRDIYASGTIRAGSFDLTSTSATTTIAGHLAVQGNTRLGDATTDLIDVTGRFSTSLLPNQNNTLDFGAYGNAWRDIYASGTLRVGSSGSNATSTFADAIAVDTSDFVVIPGTNRVGFGTANPTLSQSGGGLHIVSTNGQIRLQNNTNSGWAFAEYYDESAVGRFIQGYRDSDNSFRTMAGTTFASGNGFVLNSSGHLFPSVDNSLDFGIFGNAWRDIYASGTLRVGSTATLNSDSLTFTTGTIAFGATGTFRSTPTDVASNAAHVFNTTATLSNARLLRLLNNGTEYFAVDSAGNVAASGTLFITGTGSSTFAGPIRPSSNNAIDLGGFGSAWRDINASGTLRVGDGTLTTAAIGITTGNSDRAINFSGSGTFRSTPTDVASNAAYSFKTSNTLSNASLLRLLSNDTDQFSVGPTGNVAASGSIFARGSTASSTFNHDIVLDNGSRQIISFGFGTRSAPQDNIASGWKTLLLDGPDQRAGLGVDTDELWFVVDNTDAVGEGFGFYQRNSATIGSGTYTERFFIQGNTGNVAASGTILSTGLLPIGNNSRDIGAFASAWRDIYASNTLRIGSSTTTLTLDGR
ncbi:MAG: hypothetical protein AAB562_04665, partial [Patescibacteria group bacterium]